jgi:hypothetical protein
MDTRKEPLSIVFEISHRVIQRYGEPCNDFSQIKSPDCLPFSDCCENIGIIARLKETVLYQTARLTQADDLSRRIPEKLLERSGQMRLIEIASLINGVEDRNSLL